jgi:hypothetical protein
MMARRVNLRLANDDHERVEMDMHATTFTLIIRA